ncbi:hypothetical protein AAFC00_005128 [Neodothiora populina]|uniref:Uncharacterized protein n=1 Tax=Neodothiora populina TaxID=2781224 RepID=A0ABR3PK93_9PEZI
MPERYDRCSRSSVQFVNLDLLGMRISRGILCYTHLGMIRSFHVAIALKSLLDEI